MQHTVAIALSGGIDSLVSAALLKEQGHAVIGLHFITGFEAGFQHAPVGACSGTDPAGPETRALRQLTPMVDRLDIPVHIIDLRRDFRRLVVDYFIQTYQTGKTPNPCLVCNPAIKFDILYKKAQTYGARRIATGHYARVQRSPDGRMHLLRGIDPAKDQSYFLARLSQQQLDRAILPLGAFTKDQTRQMADQRGLRPAFVQESQDICFIRNASYGDFLKEQPDFETSPGIIEDINGRPLGTHSGLHQFTIGQRRGINCPAAEPYYVVALDAKRNTLIVGSKTDLQAHSCRVEQINWIGPPPGESLDVQVRIRYRHAAVPARLIPRGPAGAQITFDEPQSAVTPGQGAVFYQADEVLGGGWIQ